MHNNNGGPPLWSSLFFYFAAPELQRITKCLCKPGGATFKQDGPEFVRHKTNYEIMKRVCLIFVAIMSLSQFTMGQKTQFGIKGGLNLSSVSDDEVPDNSTSMRPGYHLGGLAHIHISPSFAVQPEIFYSKEGANYDFATYSGKTDLHLIRVPILAQYMTPGGFRVQTGPQFGYITSARHERQDGTEVGKTDIDQAELSWTVGLGYLTRSGFGVDARYNHGLTNLYKEGTHQGKEAKGRVGQIGIFYQFKH